MIYEWDTKYRVNNNKRHGLQIRANGDMMIYTVKKNSFIFILILLFTACEDDIVVKKYYYEVYQFEDSIPCGYQAVKIIDKNNKRKNIIYQYSVFRKEINYKKIAYYKLDKNNMFWLRNANDDTGKLYLSTKYKDSCIIYGYDDEVYNKIAAITHCYIGKKRIKLSENNYIKSYEFYQECGLGIDAVLCRIFYDKSFIPIKVEYLQNTRTDLIIRTNNIPSEFKLLLSKEQEWITESN